eukprot:TRINITY_DN12271_c0_g1_i1.p1 TRINITY_DN12271_c0_g1~~TRINITY_DN12271_c0_g1_i1.p1  ORF type:complete len:308 (+),score=56.14 TRINITY_DN12271_c0_g1_i1:510-1433(+)
MVRLLPKSRRAACGCCSALVIIITGIVLLLLSFKKISSAEVGLRYNRVAKSLAGSITGPGLHFGPPGFKYVKFPSVYQSRNSGVTCVSNDGLPIFLGITYQFLVNSTDLRSVALQYHDYGKYLLVLDSAAAASCHWACSQFQVGDFQAERSVVQNTTRDRLQANVQPLRAIILDVQLRNVTYPPAWSTAVALKEQASYDITLASQERQQAISKANGDLLLANQNATITIQIAQTQANVLQAQANYQGQALLTQFKTEADKAAQIQQTLNLTTEGLLAYLANRAVGSRTGILDVAMDAPAQISYSTEL